MLDEKQVKEKYPDLSHNYSLFHERTTAKQLQVTYEKKPLVQLHYDSIEDIDLVCIDGIEFIQNKKEWEVGLFNLINNSLQTGCRLIFTSSYNHEKAIFTLPDLDSRIKKFSSYELFPIGDDYLLDALKNIAKLSSISLGDREAQYLITYTKRNMSDLVKILESLDQLSMENKRRITIPLIKELL